MKFTIKSKGYYKHKPRKYKKMVKIGGYKDSKYELPEIEITFNQYLLAKRNQRKWKLMFNELID